MNWFGNMTSHGNGEKHVKEAEKNQVGKDGVNGKERLILMIGQEMHRGMEIVANGRQIMGYEALCQPTFECTIFAAVEHVVSTAKLVKGSGLDQWQLNPIEILEKWLPMMTELSSTWGVREVSFQGYVPPNYIEQSRFYALGFIAGGDLRTTISMQHMFERGHYDLLTFGGFVEDWNKFLARPDESDKFPDNFANYCKEFPGIPYLIIIYASYETEQEQPDIRELVSLLQAYFAKTFPTQPCYVLPCSISPKTGKGRELLMRFVGMILHHDFSDQKLKN